MFKNTLEDFLDVPVIWVSGPTLGLFDRIGLGGPQIVLSTGFYSRGALKSVTARCSSRELVFMGRLNFDSLKEWVSGSVDPKALLDSIDELRSRNVGVRIFVSPSAHAKLYVGQNGVISGSANLTVRGFGGGMEIVSLMDRVFRPDALAATEDYSRRLQEITRGELASYVTSNLPTVLRLRKRLPREDRLPRLKPNVPNPRPGSYDDFQRWLLTLDTDAAQEIYDRAQGKGQLSGHIRHGFYGLRQYLMTYPEEIRYLSRFNPTVYRTLDDPRTEAKLKEFVERNANDEPGFKLDTWKTYLPIELGGRAGRRGGTIGNINRMAPLIARYLSQL